MSKVSITRSLLDDLAMSISAKSGEAVPLTLTEMKDAVDGIQTGGSPTLQTKTKTYTPTTSQQTESVTADSGYDGLDAVNVTVNAMPTGTAGTPAITVGALARGERKISASVTNTAGYIDDGTLDANSVYLSAAEFVTGSKTITENGTSDVTTYESVVVNVPSTQPTIQSLTVTPTTSQQTFNASGVDGYKPVTVNAMPSGTAGTPTATKGTVSNHSISVTPSVTNTTGYITGGTKTGTAVTVSASELVSGSETKTSNGTYDVTNLAELVVNVSSSTPAISVVDTTDFAGGTIRTITALDISDTTATASDVASGKYFYTANGTKTAGTGSGGGGGGLVYETGTYTPSSDSTTPYIYFTDTHSTYPIYINIVDVTETLATENSMLSWTFVNWYDTYNSYFKGTSSTNYYGRYLYQYKTSSGVSAGTNESTTLTSNSGGLYFLLDNTVFAPYSFGSSRYWRSGRTYKWVAIWAPTA